MSEIDFNKPGFPYKRGYPESRFRSEADEYSRLTLLPMLRQLTQEQKAVFDREVVGIYAPEVTEIHPHTVNEVIRRLTLTELQQIASSIQFVLKTS